MVSKRSSKKKRERNHIKHDKQESHTKKLAIGMGVFIVFIMITSVFGVMFYGYDSGGQTERYGKYKFTLTNLGYEMKHEGEKYYFEILPQNLEDLDVNQGIKNILKSSQAIIITSDPNSSYLQDIALASYNINSFFMNQNKVVGVGFINKSEKNPEIPVITCENASLQFPVLELVESNETNTEILGNCIKYNFNSGYGLRALVSKTLYDYMGVFDEN